MDYYSVMKRNEYESVLMRRMNLEPVIYSEVSQKEKKILYNNAYVCNLEKWLLMNLFVGQEWRYRYREQTCGPGGMLRIQ